VNQFKSINVEASKNGRRSIVDAAFDTSTRKYRRYWYRYFKSIAESTDVDTDSPVHYIYHMTLSSIFDSYYQCLQSGADRRAVYITYSVRCGVIFFDAMFFFWTSSSATRHIRCKHITPYWLHHNYVAPRVRSLVCSNNYISRADRFTLNCADASLNVSRK